MTQKLMFTVLYSHEFMAYLAAVQLYDVLRRLYLLQIRVRVLRLHSISTKHFSFFFLLIISILPILLASETCLSRIVSHMNHIILCIHDCICTLIFVITLDSIRDIEPITGFIVMYNFFIVSLSGYFSDRRENKLKNYPLNFLSIGNWTQM